MFSYSADPKPAITQNLVQVTFSIINLILLCCLDFRITRIKERNSVEKVIIRIINKRRLLSEVYLDLTEFLSLILVILKSKQHNSIKLTIEKVTCTKFCVQIDFG